MRKPLVMLVAAAVLAACGSTAPPPPNAPVAPLTEPPATASGGAVASGSAVASPAPPATPAPPPAPDPAKAKADLLAGETAAWTTAQPAFEKACASCHTKTGKKAAKKKLDHFDMTSYPLAGHHAGMIGYTIREVLGLGDKKATMPYGNAGSVQGDDLAKIKAWSDAWETAEKAGVHPPHGPDKDDD